MTLLKLKKENTVCFTGHRPNKLPWGYNEKGLGFFLFKYKLKREILKAIKMNYVYFISGMALGIDIIAAEIILKLKKKHYQIKLECAIPCINQTKKWKLQDTKRYNKILEQSDTVTYLSDKLYFKGCMQARNKYMIENSILLIAVFNGTDGGTKQTIRLAQKNKLKIKIIKI